MVIVTTLRMKINLGENTSKYISSFISMSEGLCWDYIEQTQSGTLRSATAT